MKTDFIIDNSIVMAWCFEDESTPFTDAIQDRLVDNTAFVPAIWPLEMANVLLVAERKKRIRKADSDRFIALVSALPIIVETTISVQIFHDILPLARKYKLSSYDAAYLELAIHKKLPIASLDQAIVKTAKQAKVPVI
jgi:predicted nucleic acid-binding protein